MKKPSMVTGIALLAVFGLAAADAFLIIDTQPWTQSIAAVPTNANTAGGSTSSKASDVPIPSVDISSQAPTGVAKQTGPDVASTIIQMGFTKQDTQDRMFLPAIISDSIVQKQVLLRNGDRAGLIAWTESGKVKIYYLALKEALFGSFTPAVTNLVDQTQQREGLPPRNYLTFKDTGISQEQIVFIRIRDRLYEIHITSGQEESMNTLIEELSK